MRIEHKQNGTKGSFFVESETGRTSAEMTYTRAGEKRIIIDHTEVDDIHRGKGVGLKLVEAAVEMARKEGLMILPLCPFAKSVFDRRAEFRDVLDR